VWESKVSEEWQIIFYRDSDGTEPVQEFLLDPSLTSGELKQFQVRVMLLTQKGLSLLLERSDILDKIEGETFDTPTRFQKEGTQNPKTRN
jgi:hypothetical protein